MTVFTTSNARHALHVLQCTSYNACLVYGALEYTMCIKQYIDRYIK